MAIEAMSVGYKDEDVVKTPFMAGKHDGAPKNGEQYQAIPPPYMGELLDGQEVLMVGKRRSPARIVAKVFKAVACTVVMYMLLVAIGRSIFQFTVTELDSTGIFDMVYGPGVDFVPPEEQHITYMPPINNNGHCTRRTYAWRPGPPRVGPRGKLSHAVTTFNFSTPSPALESFFVTSGIKNADGKLFVDASAKDTNVTRVVVHAYYKDEKALDYTNICPLGKKPNEHGIGIFSDRSWSRDKFVNFEVFLHLPIAKSPENSTSTFKSLTASLNDFGIHIQDMSDHVNFATAVLATSNGPISSKNLTANFIDVHTSNGAIWGNFSVLDFGVPLVLRTSNAGINVNVTVVSNGTVSKRLPPHRGEPRAAQVYLTTSNGRIDADFALVSTADASAPVPPYSLSATSSNKPIYLAVNAQPLNSSLYLSSHTSNAPTNVTLHPSYEGTYVLSTSGYIKDGRGATLEVNDEVEDPSGEDRERVINKRVYRGGMMGSVHWGAAEQGENALRYHRALRVHEEEMDDEMPMHISDEKPHGGKERRGTVSVTTSNAPIVLFL